MLKKQAPGETILKVPYLQVVEGNTPARNLYESLGLHYLYTYWFRVQTHTN